MEKWSRRSLARWNDPGDLNTGRNDQGLLNSKYNDHWDLNAERNEQEDLNTEQNYNYHRVLNSIGQDLSTELYEHGDFNAVRYGHGYLEPTMKNSTQSESIMKKLNSSMSFYHWGLKFRIQLWWEY